MLKKRWAGPGRVHERIGPALIGTNNKKDTHKTMKIVDNV